MLAAGQHAHYFHDGAAGARLLRGARARPARAAPMAGAPKLAREHDAFVVSMATPGVQLEHLEVELVGSRVLHLRVRQPYAAPHTPAGRALRARANQAPPSAAYYAAAPPAGGAPEAEEAAEAPADAGSAEAAAAATHDGQAAAGPQDAHDADSEGATAPAADAAEAPTAESQDAEGAIEQPRQLEGAAAAAFPYYAGGDASGTSGVPAADQGGAEAHTVVVLDKSVALPQPVDEAGIACTYQDGLLRIVIPIAAPAPDTEHEERTAGLQQAVSEAAAELAVFEQQVRDQREKVRAAHAALRAARAEAGPARARRRQPLRIVAAAAAGGGADAVAQPAGGADSVVQQPADAEAPGAHE